MKDRELDEILRAAPLPERSPEDWERFARGVLGRLKERNAHPDEPMEAGSADRGVRAPVFRRGRWDAWAWLRQPGPACAAALAVTCLAAGFALGFRRGHAHAIAARDLGQAQTYFREIAALFPHQLEAIVFDQQGAHLVLAQRADVPASPPVYVTVRDATGWQRFVTFSGRQIRVHGAVFDVLLDRQGDVLLLGSRAVWSSAQANRKLGPYEIRAALLPARS
jgi:hypothetical protein